MTVARRLRPSLGSTTKCHYRPKSHVAVFFAMRVAVVASWRPGDAVCDSPVRQTAPAVIRNRLDGPNNASFAMARRGASTNTKRTNPKRTNTPPITLRRLRPGPAPVKARPLEAAVTIPLVVAVPPPGEVAAAVVVVPPPAEVTVVVVAGGAVVVAVAGA